MSKIAVILSFLNRHRGNSLILLLFSLLYGPILVYWINGWLNKTISTEHEYFSVALLGFPYAGYLIFGQNRQGWGALKSQTHWSAFLLLAIASAFYLTGVSLWVALSFPLMIMGLITYLKGYPGLRLNAFPLLLIVLGTPTVLPYLLIPFLLPLQQLIAALCGGILMLLGIDVKVQGIFLAVNGSWIEVAPYCAGLKMWFTCLYVALMLLYNAQQIHNRHFLLTLLAGATLISLGGNIVRNTLLSWFQGHGDRAGFEFIHDGLGGDLYSFALLLLVWGCYRWLNTKGFKTA